MDSQVELVWDARCEIGECCTWDAAHRRVLFCDIPAGVIHAWATDGGGQQSWTLPDIVPSFGVCRSGRWVVALRHRIAVFDPASSSVRHLAGPVDEPDALRLNDGKVGPDGCFWVGSMDDSPARQKIASLYRVTPDGRIEKKAEGYGVSNGLAWSPDGRTMFHSDTRGPYIDAWDFDPANGRISNRRRLATLSEEEGRPDGGATDAEGCYWSAGISAGCLNRFSASGRLLAKVKLPVPAPTMPCFADKHIYVTTLRHGRDPQLVARHPTLGGLFRFLSSVSGAPVGLFADV